MSRYYLDTEFNDYQGELISLALVREEDQRSLYLVYPAPKQPTLWVSQHVLPILYRAGIRGIHVDCDGCASSHRLLEDYFEGDRDIVIVADWPDDIAYFSKAVLTGPGKMINIPGYRTEVVRVDPYPSEMYGLIQHHAWCDAMALRYKLFVNPTT